MTKEQQLRDEAIARYVSRVALGAQSKRKGFINAAASFGVSESTVRNALERHRAVCDHEYTTFCFMPKDYQVCQNCLYEVNPSEKVKAF